MLKSSARSVIRLRGVRHNNLKNFDLDLPLKKLIVITGLSGSGKSSLAFDTLFAEGQRRYIETFSPYARQFFDRMDKPQVDSIEDIPPAIAIEQRNTVRTTRSTVGTMTEICDYMKMLWPHIAQLNCRQCGQHVRKDSPQMIWEELTSAIGDAKPDTTKNSLNGNSFSGAAAHSELLITFYLPLTTKLSLSETLGLIAKQGYQRLLDQNKIFRLDELTSAQTRQMTANMRLTVIQDRLRLTESNRARFIEACEQAYHFGNGKLTIHEVHGSTLPAAQGVAEPTVAHRFSNRLHCARCDIEYREPSPALFSFNNPVGACPACRGFGRIISIDYDRAIPDRSRTLAGGVVKPWQVGHGLESQNDLLKMCRHFEIPTDVPFCQLSKKWQTFVIEGDPDYGKDEEHEWPRAWYGVKGYFRWLESKAYKMHVRVLLSRYRAYTTCPDCHGMRFQPETLLYCVNGQAPKATKAQEADSPLASFTLADFYLLPIRDALKFIERLSDGRPVRTNNPLHLVFNEVRSRLGYLNEVGLGYLTLDRPTRSLSGGETERVNLTTCLGTRLVNTLFVLDEPSVGLHSRDTERLVRILQQLRDAGNTVVVVEHEASVMRAADQIVDLGPGHGATGGEVVFQGAYQAILRNKRSLTGHYLSGRRQIAIPERRPVRESAVAREGLYSSIKTLESEPYVLNEAPGPFLVTRYEVDSALPRRKALKVIESALVERTKQVARSSKPATLKLAHATRHNVKELTVEIPLNRFVCVTGVSGSGKTTLIREILLPLLQGKLQSAPQLTKPSDRLTSQESENENGKAEPANDFARLEGWENLNRAVLVDQSTLGKTPRSNPAVYIGAFDDIREFFAQSEPARQRGLGPSAFSFNSGQGQCQRCRGAGFEKIEMQFLSDVFIRCPECKGRRYRPHILEIKLFPRPLAKSPGLLRRGKKNPRPSLGVSIADLLEHTIEEAIVFLSPFSESRPAQRAASTLRLLADVGLGYLKLGQPINTLSGGESQRLKLVHHIAESNAPGGERGKRREAGLVEETGFTPTLFLFDEPTTGLHFEDVRMLLKVFQRLVDAGHSLVVIEHNLDVIKTADWIIDLGPDAGDEGGSLVTEGTPEHVATCAESHTGKALQQVLASHKSPQHSVRE